MRIITDKIVGAFNSQVAAKAVNTYTDGTALYLHGNKIAEYRNDGLYVSAGGYKVDGVLTLSNTTRERLNGIDGVQVYQSKKIWYLNGKEWDGSWTRVAVY